MTTTEQRQLSADVVIIGAGPVGLFQIFELGLQGLNAVVIDSLAHVGGQCMELYPDKPIYDIPALPGATARNVIDNLVEQARPFNPRYLLGHRVDQVESLGPSEFRVVTDQGQRIHCRAVVIAGGNGAFEPVRLKIPGIERFEGQQLTYRAEAIDNYRGKDLVILGGGDAALDWALTLQPVAASVLLIHRSHNFRANAQSVQRLFAHCDNLEMQFLCGQVKGFEQTGGRLRALSVQSKDGVTRKVGLDSLLVCFGLSPKPGPIADWGLAMHHHQVRVDTARFETSVPGIYAVGDINHYPGKRKLILSGFHEAALAAFAIAQQLAPDKRIATLYTTTSPVVHQRMGVNPDLADLVEA